MRIDRHIWSAQRGNWVWVHTGRRKISGQIVTVHDGGPGAENEYTVRLTSGEEVRALQRELRRCREPKRIRNADWLKKHG